MPYVFPGIFLATALLVMGAPSHAQTEKSARSSVASPSANGAGADYRVTFDDDPLHALGADVLVPRIQVRLPPQRALLIRPRTSFVPEMLKTVEKM